MSVWRLNPILPEVNSPPNNVFNSDTVPLVGDVTALLGLGVEASNIALTEVTSSFYVYTFGLSPNVPCIYTLIKFDA